MKREVRFAHFCRASTLNLLQTLKRMVYDKKIIKTQLKQK